MIFVCVIILCINVIRLLLFIVDVVVDFVGVVVVDVVGVIDVVWFIIDVVSGFNEFLKQSSNI